MEVKIVRENKNLPLPKYARDLDAGMDVFADIEEKIILKPGKRVTISTGIRVGIPEGYEIQVRPKSGKASKNGITVLNTPGCVDAGYQDLVGVILINLGEEDFEINFGDKIAQIVLKRFEKIEWKEVEDLDGYDRGGGFGHTDKEK